MRYIGLFIALSLMYAALAPALASAEDLLSAMKSEIDATNRNNGYIRARSKAETSKKLKLTTSYAKSDGTKLEYRYDLKSAGTWETYSLQSGNGKYTISVLENVTGARYTVVHNVKLDVVYSRENAPFLVSAQNVNYSADSNAVKKAEELCKTAGTDLKKVENVYKYIVETIKYDTNKADKIASGEISAYLPKIDDTLKTSRGICLDYSALLAAMLRSQGVPAKLVTGYVSSSSSSSKSLYHAWNEVYIKNVGWVKIRSQVYFDGKKWGRMDSTFASGNTDGKRTQFIANDKNYAKDKEY